MIETWKKKFSAKQLSLAHEKPTVFIVSQWQRDAKPCVSYLIYRWVVAIIFFITLVISIVDLKHPGASHSFRAKWLIYLTNWGYLICNIQALLAALILSVCVFIPELQEKVLKFYKLYWVTNILGTDIAFGVTTLYWSLIYDEKTMEFDAMNYFVHANNSLLMMIDLFVVSHPIRLLHCCYPVVFGLCYALFSVIFYAAGGISREGHRYIYTILNWDKPRITTVICIAVVGYIVIVHIVTWSLHRLRLWIHFKYFAEKTEESEEISVDEKSASKMLYLNEGMVSDVV